MTKSAHARSFVIASVTVLALAGVHQSAVADSKAKGPGVVVTFDDESRTFSVQDKQCGDNRVAYVRYQYQIEGYGMSKVFIIESDSCNLVQLANGRSPDVPTKRSAVVYYRACHEAPGEHRCSKLKTDTVPTLKEARAKAAAEDKRQSESEAAGPIQEACEPGSGCG